MSHAGPIVSVAGKNASDQTRSNGVSRQVLDGVLFEGTPLPPFGQFLHDVGAWAALAAHEKRSLHVGLLLPTDAYAAVLVALGAAVRRSDLAPLSGGEDAAKRLDQLSRLDIGEPVWFLDRGRKYKAFYEGTAAGSDGVVRTLVRTEGHGRGGLTQHLPAERILDVVPATEAAWEDLPLSQKGVALRGSPELVEAVFGREVNAVLTVPRVDAVVVGRKAAVVEDLDLPCSSATGEGRLCDLVRLKEAGFGSSYRSRWVSARSTNLDEVASAPHRPVVVLNGATNHLDGFYRAQGGVTVSVLGAAEPQSMEAVEDLQSALFMGTHRPGELPADIRVPPGVSVFVMET
jgi:hypothetical protein